MPLNHSQSAMSLHSFAPVMEPHEIGGEGEGGGGVSGGFPSLEEQIVPFQCILLAPFCNFHFMLCKYCMCHIGLEIEHLE